VNFEEIKRYWEERAAGDSSAQSTTQDLYLREIEFNALAERIRRYRPTRVADVGCGDGRTTARLSKELPDSTFSGFDYASSMVQNARQIHSAAGFPNLTFAELDVCKGLDTTFDLVYTTRCLINLPSWDLQRAAIDSIHAALNDDGVYLMVENFVEGQANFNKVRADFGLPEISIRNHNLFFQRGPLLEYFETRFVVEEELNISSTYYLMSRVIYSKICSETGKQPDYLDDHHRFAVGLPFSGEFGPVRLLCLKKKAVK
jgi:SAM-dependent methyltransferase